jgi:hypothetical protein
MIYKVQFLLTTINWQYFLYSVQALCWLSRCSIYIKTSRRLSESPKRSRARQWKTENCSKNVLCRHCNPFKTDRRGGPPTLNPPYPFPRRRWDAFGGRGWVSIGRWRCRGERGDAAAAAFDGHEKVKLGSLSFHQRLVPCTLLYL